MASSARTVGALCTQWMEPLAETLSGEPGMYVIVTNRSARILYANKASARWLNLNGHAEAPASFADVLPEAVHQERSAYIRDVVDHDTQVTIDGIIDGEGLRCTMRPLPGGGGFRPAVLHVFIRISLVGQQWTIPDDVVIARSNDLGVLQGLTGRELETLAMIALGLTSEQMAGRIHRSRRTVDCHRAAVSQKLRVRSGAHLAMLALRAGLVQMINQSDWSDDAGPQPAIVDEFLNIAVATAQADQ